MQNKDIMVIGDIIVDRYIFGSVSRISPEAPIPVVKVDKIEDRPGGAANVAMNIASLDRRPIMISASGIREEFSIYGFREIDWNVFWEADRQPTIKHRIICDGHHIARYDIEETTKIKLKTEECILNRMELKAPQCNAIVISDYGKGVITGRIINTAIELKKIYEIPIFVDTKQHMMMYAGVDIITPNIHEYEKHTDPVIRTILKSGTNIVVTMGPGGIALVQEKPEFKAKFPTLAKQVVDVTGAGDTVLAALAVFLSTKDQENMIEEAIEFANNAAAIVISKTGTSTVTLDEIAEEAI